MHILTGFIQLLLILTNNRLLPDLASAFRPITTVYATVSAPASGTNFQQPTPAPSIFQAEALQREDKEKRTGTARRAEPVFRLIVQKQIIWPGLVSGITKLYLVFCQMKTEG